MISCLWTLFTKSCWIVYSLESMKVWPQFSMFIYNRWYVYVILQSFRYFYSVASKSCQTLVSCPARVLYICTAVSSLLFMHCIFTHCDVFHFFCIVFFLLLYSIPAWSTNLLRIRGTLPACSRCSCFRLHFSRPAMMLNGELCIRVLW
jgi:hypothetical protein